MLTTFRLSLDEVNSADMYRVRANAHENRNDLIKFCQNNRLHLTSNLLNDIVSQELGPFIISYAHDDLLFSYDYYQNLNQLCTQNNKILGIVTRNYVGWQDFSNVKFLFNKKLLGVFNTHYKQPLEMPSHTKLYNCLMQRADPLRQSFLYWLKHYNLLDQGFVSYLCVSTPKTKEGLLSPQYIYDAIQQSDNSQYEFMPPNIETLILPPNADKIYNWLRNKIPYQNFDEQYTLDPMINNSKYSLVIDTFAAVDERGCWAFTEKVFRSLQLPTIPLLFVQKYGISKLATMGFAFPDFYQELDAQVFLNRQAALLNIIVNDLLTVSPQVLLDNARHNRDLLSNWHSDLSKEQFWQDLFVDFC